MHLSKQTSVTLATVCCTCALICSRCMNSCSSAEGCLSAMRVGGTARITVAAVFQEAFTMQEWNVTGDRCSIGGRSHRSCEERGARKKGRKHWFACDEAEDCSCVRAAALLRSESVSMRCGPLTGYPRRCPYHSSQPAGYPQQQTKHYKANQRQRRGLRCKAITANVSHW